MEINHPSKTNTVRIRDCRAPIPAKTAVSSFFSKINILKDPNTFPDMMIKIKPKRRKMMIFSVFIILYNISFSW